MLSNAHACPRGGGAPLWPPGRSPRCCDPGRTRDPSHCGRTRSAYRLRAQRRQRAGRHACSMATRPSRRSIGPTWVLRRPRSRSRTRRPSEASLREGGKDRFVDEVSACKCQVGRLLPRWVKPCRPRVGTRLTTSAIRKLGKAPCSERSRSDLSEKEVVEAAYLSVGPGKRLPCPSKRVG